MIHGIGVDIVQIARMDANVERFGDRFAQRILTASEMVEYRSQAPALRGRFLAKRFAAKEAAAKALGTGFRDGLGLHDIGVGHDAMGRPLLEYSGRAGKLCANAGICASHLSLSDETRYAIASVTLEK
jgi:holo-[acyl-carrier protein] synthase